ncbi:hypothetical protein [Corynebacterium endometrii]|uniref:Uncharacterized protein n=1 Tax=Corynebacterium endometrii TaxID=2488819 RepID=A0A4P7QGL0_9CORY|nr:hypothetical protein [Corynebacterium endometrii]QCB28902.1 hypothetical protein CENDO_08150 [Corynebacterium endometrii]
MNAAPARPACSEPARSRSGTTAVPVIPAGIEVVVLEVSGMPTFVRPRIERAMVDCLVSESYLSIPGADPLEASWCTRWRRDAVSTRALALGVGGQRGGLSCREVLTGTPGEIEALRERVAALAERYGFNAGVREVR